MEIKQEQLKIKKNCAKAHTPHQCVATKSFSLSLSLCVLVRISVILGEKRNDYMEFRFYLNLSEEWVGDAYAESRLEENDGEK